MPALSKTSQTESCKPSRRKSISKLDLSQYSVCRMQMLTAASLLKLSHAWVAIVGMRAAWLLYPMCDHTVACKGRRCKLHLITNFDIAINNICHFPAHRLGALIAWTCTQYPARIICNQEHCSFQQSFLISINDIMWISQWWRQAHRF